MLYLIKSWTEEGPILKIGYASEIDTRMISYKTHNPGYKLLGTREGDEELESKFHKFLILYSYNNFPEWFWFNEEIIRIFKEEPDEFFSNPIETCSKKLTTKEKEEIRVNNLVLRYPKSKEFFKNFFLKLTHSKDKMKFLCEFLPNHKEVEEEILMNVPLAYKNYYLVLGPERCWQFSYQMSKLEDEYQRQLSSQRVSLGDIQKIIYDTFQEGERYTKSDLKTAIQGIYDSLGLKKTGKANDFEYWFEITPCTITNSQTKKRENGFKLIKRKF